MKRSSANICLLTETYHPVTGGGETEARVLASGFVSAGSDIQVLTRRTDSRLPRSDTLDGATLWRLSPTGPGHLRKWGLVFSAFFKLLRLRRSYDVILVCGYRVLGIPSVVAGRILGKPCILKADSIGEFSGEFFDPGLKRFGLDHTRFPVNVALVLRNRLLRRARSFLAISSVIADELQGHGVEAARIRAIPNSVDTDRFTPVTDDEKLRLREALGISRDKRVAIYTGRLVSTKGLPLLLRSWSSVVKMHPDALLMLVGSGGLGIQNCEQDLRDFVRDSALETAVMFTGSVDNVHEYLQASDFFVFPTEREAFGISLIEAFACGLPVITTSTGGVRDIVRDQENALVVPVNDADALTTAIDKMIRRGDWVDALAANGRRVAVERYSESRVLHEYRELIENLQRGGFDR
jgi:glycosyltransferase involved in cell wall biosynthesis